MEAKDRILKVLDNFGMSYKKGAEIIDINYNTFKRYINEKDGSNKLTDKNYEDLVDFLFFESVNLREDLNLKSEKIVNDMIYRIENLIKSQLQNRISKEREIDIVTEFCKIIDSMETSDVFINFDPYDKIIKRIENDSKLLGEEEEWSILKYKIHLGKSKHDRSNWSNYLAKKRINNINNILK